MGRIIINADDAGLHPSIDAGIQQCISAGVVNSISVITNSPQVNFDLINQWNKTVLTGVHLSWLGVPWLTRPYFFFSWKEFLSAFIFKGPQFRAQVLEEGREQIKMLQSQGVSVAHLDSHQHVHHFPVLWDYCLLLQREFGIPRIRCAKTKKGYSKTSLSGFSLQLMAAAKSAPGSFICAGIQHAGNYSREQLENEMQAYAGNNVEFVVHPGVNNYALNKHFAHWHFDWEKETRALLALDVKKLAAENGFTF
jgi:chitin disaccharide deacetylase